MYHKICHCERVVRGCLDFVVMDVSYVGSERSTSARAERTGTGGVGTQAHGPADVSALGFWLEKGN